ncbi:MAG: hypothetical protein QNJ06_22650 [Kiloniellales bacterium]|nr:hypothetical protein [Kiloniellales bacterium]
MGGAAMTKDPWTGDFASRHADFGFSAAAKTPIEAIGCISFARWPGRTRWMALGEILFAVSLFLSLLVWLPTQAWSQPDPAIGDGPVDYMVYLSFSPDSRSEPQIERSAKHQQRRDIGSALRFRAEPVVLRTDYIAHFNDSVRQDLDGRFDRDAHEDRPVKAGGSGIALASQKIEPAAAVLVVETPSRLAERTAAPGSAMVLPLVQPSGPSGAAVVSSLREFLALPRIKTGLLLLHLLGLVLGVGTATLLDLFIARSLRSGRFSKEQFEFIRFASSFVFAGILLLWISGLSFLLYYYFESPTGLENPKVWAKISIVAILSLNGLYIHKQVLPELKRNAGFSIFHGTSKAKRSMMLVSGAVSVVSWYAPLVIGTAKELNFTVSAPAILIAYGVALALAILGSHVLYALLAPRKSSSLRSETTQAAGSEIRRSTRGATPSAEAVPATAPLLASA